MEQMADQANWRWWNWP